jgi:hypothetical protein
LGFFFIRVRGARSTRFMSISKKTLLRKVQAGGGLGWLLVFFSFAITGCFLMPVPPSSRVDLTAPVYPEPRDRGCEVELLTSPPAAPHKAFAQISVRGDETQMAKMEEKVKEEACGLGADAVITFVDSSDVRLYQDSYPDWVEREPHTMIKNYGFSLIGIAIVYQDQATKVH